MVVGSRYHRYVRGPMLYWNRYLTPQLPPSPARTDYWAKAASFLHTMMLNDTVGDCTIAAWLHILGAWLLNAGVQPGFGNKAALWIYEQACGYVPGDPSTDQGGNEQDVLNFVQQHGSTPGGLHGIVGWAAMNAANFEGEVKPAVHLMENGYLGFSMPDAWIATMSTLKDGDVWDVAGLPNQNNGHAVAIIDYEPGGVWIDTWGFRIWLTKAALAKYCVPSAYGEAYTLFGTESIIKATGKSPDGFNAAQLLADLKVIGANA
jgi:hypothetical protein